MRDETRNALSLVATRASGLKSQFGSMGKPFNAGVAASNGVEAAQLPKRGFARATTASAGAGLHRRACRRSLRGRRLGVAAPSDLPVRGR